jgi:hypothetical protein
VEQVYECVKDLDERAWNVLIADTRLVSKDIQTDFQTVLLKSKIELSAMRSLHTANKQDVPQLRRTVGIVTVINPVEKIFPASAFIDLSTIKMSRYDDIAKVTVEISLKEYITQPQYHGAQAALFLGGPDTTGYGKTRLAMRIAWMWAKQYAEELGEPTESAYFLKVNNIDSIRTVQQYMRSGKPIILDEMEMSTYLIYLHILSFNSCLSISG